MQSEIGGLFYEMAIRDHIRIEVLMQKAAELQRVDAELGQVERLLEGGHTTAGGNCAGLWRGVRPRRGVLRPMREPAGRDMIARLREIRLRRLALVLVATLSGLATAVVIATALGSTSAQSAASEALHHRTVVVPRGRDAACARDGRRPAADPSPARLRSTRARTPAQAPTRARRPPLKTASPAAADTSAPTSDRRRDTTTPTSPTAPQHKVGHVFEIALSTTSFEAAFGSSQSRAT